MPDYTTRHLQSTSYRQIPQLVVAAAVEASRVLAVPSQCDVDCAAGQSAAEADQLLVLVWLPAGPSHVTALLVLCTC